MSVQLLAGIGVVKDTFVQLNSGDAIHMSSRNKSNCSRCSIEISKVLQINQEQSMLLDSALDKRAFGFLSLSPCLNPCILLSERKEHVFCCPKERSRHFLSKRKCLPVSIGLEWGHTTHSSLVPIGRTTGTRHVASRVSNMFFDDSSVRVGMLRCRRWHVIKTSSMYRWLSI